MLAKGEWRQTATSKGVAGFHINEIYSPWVKFQNMVDDWLEAKKSPDTLQVFINTSLGEVWEQGGERINESILMERQEEYPSEVPREVCVLTCGVDVQDNRIETEVVGWGIGEESWNIDNRVLEGDPSRMEVWKELDIYLAKEFKHESGINMKIACTCIDTGFATQEVYSFVKERQHRRIFAVKGQSQPGRPIVGRPTTGNNQHVRLFPIGTDTAKELIYGRLKIEAVGPSYCHFPMERDGEYFRQLTAEKLVQKWQAGRLTRKWVNTRKRNEALDMRIYATAALFLLNPDFEVLSKNIEIEAEKVELAQLKQLEVKPETKEQEEYNPFMHKNKQRRTGFVNSWKNY
jgi:phage terminase large subunit GpA-like protein